MTGPTTDLLGHNEWATLHLIALCQELTPDQLESTCAGTYGTILETLQHLVRSETSYTHRLTGGWAERPWQDDWAVGLDQLADRVQVLAAAQRSYFESGWDPDQMGEAGGDDGTVFAVPAGIFFTQLIHHANEHRAQICTVIGSLGFQAPDVSAWHYGGIADRSYVKSQPEQHLLD